MRDNLQNIVVLMDRGGEVLWAIAGLSCLLWSLLIERALFLFFSVPRSGVSGSKDQPTPTRAEYDQHLATISALVFVLPLVGLLGTVVGMIETFDVLSVFGSSNPRGLSTGISQALLTTMAGLVTSLSGLVVSSVLEKKLQAAQVAQWGQATNDDPWAVTELLRLRSRLGGVADSTMGGVE